MTERELDILLREYGGAVRAVCRAILPGHPQDAEEAEADTFYKLWRGAHMPADETHRRRLVVLTARQCAIDRYRALLRRGETLPLDDRDDAELAVALESHLESRELMAQIMALPPPDGELFLRRYLYGETAAQLGARFAMPAATVRTRLHRARLAGDGRSSSAVFGGRRSRSAGAFPPHERRQRDERTGAEIWRGAGRTNHF